ACSRTFICTTFWICGSRRNSSHSAGVGNSPEQRWHSCKQLGPSLGKAHVGAAFVPDEPAFGDRAIEAGPVPVCTAASLQEWRIDQLDEDAAVLHRLDRARDLDQLVGGDIRIGVRAGFSEFQLIRLLAALGAASRVEASAGMVVGSFDY